MQPRLQLPNVLTLLRLALAPVIFGLLIRRLDVPALGLLVMSALTDLLDGMLARRWHAGTRFGAVADPLADKLTALLVVLALAAQASLPAWLAVAVVLRDLLIMAGAVAFRLVAGRLDMQPSAISKLNTTLLFALLLATLVGRAGLAATASWLPLLQGAVALTVAASGGHYVWAWSHRAMAARRKPRAG